MAIAFIDLQAQRARIADRINEVTLKVIEGGNYIMGPEVKTFEKQLAEFCSAKHALGCASGTDALLLPLMAWKIGPGDAVFCPSFTFAATAEVIAVLGASPVFVDVDPATYNIDPAHLEATIEAVKTKGGLTPRAIIAVDLFGQPADYERISQISRKHDLKLISDSAQAFGCTLNRKHPGAWADVTCTSFFPAKPLGCYGDGGAVLTDSDELRDLIDSLRVHGKAIGADIKGREFNHDPKYLNMRVGLNSRLDTIQAAILIEKLAIFADEIEKRNAVAKRYNQGLAGKVASVPAVIKGGVSVWAQYTVEHDARDALQAHLKSKGVPTAVYYPVPIHTQPPYAPFPVGPGGLPVTEQKAQRVLSLPMHPYLDEATQGQIIQAVVAFASEQSE